MRVIRQFHSETGALAKYILSKLAKHRIIWLHGVKKRHVVFSWVLNQRNHEKGQLWIFNTSKQKPKVVPYNLHE